MTRVGFTNADKEHADVTENGSGASGHVTDGLWPQPGNEGHQRIPQRPLPDFIETLSGAQQRQPVLQQSGALRHHGARRADIDTYNAVKQQIGDTGGRLVELTTNFRSLGRICTWANTVFQQVLVPGDGASQAPHADMSPVRPEGDSNAGVRTLEVPRVHRHSAATAAANEAIAISMWIRHALDTGLQLDDDTSENGRRSIRPEDILIICPQN